MTAINSNSTMSERLSQVLNSFVSEVTNATSNATSVPLEVTSPEIDELQEHPTEESIVPEEATPVEPEVTYPSYRESPFNLEELPVIPVPENSRSILVQESTSRFSGAIWYEKIQEKDITLAGIGGIGSWVALLLSRVHPRRLVLYDDDFIEAVNMSGQFYPHQYIGQSKVGAMNTLIGAFSGYYDTVSINRRYTEDSVASKIMICGFDNMQARRTFYNNWKHYISFLSDAEREDCLFIDGRLAAEELQVLCLTGTDTFNMEKYEKEWLFSDEEADATICSYKQTTYMANMIGSIIVNLFTNFCANQADPVIPRDLPFLTSYDASLMYFKTEV